MIPNKRSVHRDYCSKKSIREFVGQLNKFGKDKKKKIVRVKRKICRRKSINSI